MNSDYKNINHLRITSLLNELWIFIRTNPITKKPLCQVLFTLVRWFQNNNSRIIISISRRTLPFVLTNFDLPTTKHALSIVWLNLTPCLCSGRCRQRICVSTPFNGEKTNRLCVPSLLKIGQVVIEKIKLWTVQLMKTKVTTKDRF